MNRNVEKKRSRQKKERTSVNLDHYPANDLPSVAEDELRSIISNPQPTPNEVNILEENIERQERKIQWAIGRSDQDARITSATASPVRAGSIRKLFELATVGAEQKISQSNRAKNPRIKVTEDGETMGSIIDRIARARPDESAKELWPCLYGELDKLGLAPKEVNHSSDLNKSFYAYDDTKNNTHRITFGHFKNKLSKVHTGKKSH